MVETKRAPLGKKEVIAKVVSIQSQPSHDIWAFGVVMYEAICGVPLSPYACRGKRAMSANEIARIGKWDESNLERALRHADADDVHALQILRILLHHDPNKRYSTLREALEHPFFSGSSEDRVLKKKENIDSRSSTRPGHPSSSTTQHSRRVKHSTRDQVAKNGISEGLRHLDQENSDNGLPRGTNNNKKFKGCDESIASGKSRGSIMTGMRFTNRKMKGLKERMKGRGQI